LLGISLGLFIPLLLDANLIEDEGVKFLASSLKNNTVLSVLALGIL